MVQIPNSPSWDKIVVRSIWTARLLSSRADYTRNHLPDSAQKPVSYAIANELIARLERHSRAILEGGESLELEFGERAGEMVRDTLELETLFVGKSKSPSFPAVAHNLIGDLLVEAGKSYSETKRTLQLIEKFFGYLGAPSKRPEALKLLDAKIVNGWSYTKLARQMCDCGAKEHSEACSERIRKRIKELKSFLDKYRIQIPGKK